MKYYWLVILLTFAFPIGVWLTLLGYELPSLFAMLAGWVGIVLLAERGVE